MLPEFAQSLYDRFDREGIPLLLAGGWAVRHHGYSRFTNDLDWVCSRQHEERALDLMRQLRFEQASEGMASRFVRGDLPGFPAVDLIWVSMESFAIMQETSERTGPRGEIPVLGFETLLAMKIHALKDHETRKGKDLLDIRFLLAEHPIDEARLRALCQRYGGPTAFDMIRTS